MKLSALRDNYRQQLNDNTIQADLELDFLLVALLGISRAKLHSFDEIPWSPQQEQQWQAWLARRVQGEPLAYILGTQPFCSLNLSVTRDTLIPRPETEDMVAWVLAAYPLASRLRVLDLGTGSGAIALALAKARPQWSIDATDNCAAALAVAGKNAALHGINNVSFYQGDWYAAVAGQPPYDLIVSNPPYVDAADNHLAALRYEPLSALVSCSGGLSDLTMIIAQGQDYLVANGALVLEHGFDQGEAVMQLLADAAYWDIHQQMDLSSKPRFVCAKKPEVVYES